MTNRFSRSLITLAATAVLALGGGVPAAVAKHGADDPPSHDVRDDHGGKRHVKHHRHGKHHRIARAAKHGADDPAGDDNGGRRRGGNDDGPNHT